MSPTPGSQLARRATRGSTERPARAGPYRARRPTSPGRWPGAALLLRLVVPLLLAPLAACELSVGPLATGASAVGLRPGVYRYTAWPDGGGRAQWWGYLEFEAGAGGAFSGAYRLPEQCVDALGYVADCVGYVGGRVERDVSLRFGLDEGWLSNHGMLRDGSRATGRWETRILGYAGSGTFELEPY